MDHKANNTTDEQASSKLLTTGQAAKRCSVTPDTILKWIRSGRLPACRTAGGHHRVDPRDLDRIVQTRGAQVEPRQPNGDPGAFRYCWEYLGNGTLPEGCRNCIVYELRARRCYEAIKLAPDIGHRRLFCASTSDECDYYQHVKAQALNILVVTDNQALVARLKDEGETAPFNLEFSDCEYACSAVVDSFRPDYAVVDCSLGRQLSADIVSHLAEDPRIPFVRVVLAGHEDEFPERCEHQVFARLGRPFGIGDLKACTAQAEDRGSGLTAS